MIVYDMSMTTYQLNRIIFFPVSPDTMMPQLAIFGVGTYFKPFWPVCTRFYIISTEFSGLWDRGEKYKAY